MNERIARTREYLLLRCFILLLTPLLFLSGCSTKLHKDFLPNFIKNNQRFEDRVVSLQFNDKEKFLAVGHESGSVDIWDAKEAFSKRVIKAHKHRANLLAFSTDGNTLFSNSYFEDTTRLWDARTGELLNAIPATRGPVSISPDERYYLIANSGDAQFFDYERKLLLPGKFRCEGVITAMASDISSGQIAVGTASGTIQVWKFSLRDDNPTLEVISQAKPYPMGDWVMALQFAPNGRSLYSVARFGSVDEWILNTFEKRRSIPITLKQIMSSAFMPDGALLAVAGTSDAGGASVGSVQIVSLLDEISSSYRADTNWPVIEFLPPLSSLIAAQYRSIAIHKLSQER